MHPIDAIAHGIAIVKGVKLLEQYQYCLSNWREQKAEDEF